MENCHIVQVPGRGHRRCYRDPVSIEAQRCSSVAHRMMENGVEKFSLVADQQNAGMVLQQAVGEHEVSFPTTGDNVAS
ncbi:hypothetical protein IE4872_PD02042 (plasmid) [Rhizobium gallicum]|uniref:Uncharacterized protein n=1 Tax=Rhizobium gallicum TaxID=56730 RepID=A0A1L5NXH1_9HYPH|nr:hypothetical protein IE4872_PD02042 [Rhizobium gallicum]